MHVRCGTYISVDEAALPRATTLPTRKRNCQLAIIARHGPRLRDSKCRYPTAPGSTETVKDELMVDHTKSNYFQLYRLDHSLRSKTCSLSKSIQRTTRRTPRVTAPDVHYETPELLRNCPFSLFYDTANTCILQFIVDTEYTFIRTMQNKLTLTIHARRHTHKHTHTGRRQLNDHRPFINRDPCDPPSFSAMRSPGLTVRVFY